MIEPVTNKTRLVEQQKTKKSTKLQNKEYELNKERTLFRKQNESNRERKQNERRQKRENLVEEDIALSRFFELATIKKNLLSI